MTEKEQRVMQENLFRQILDKLNQGDPLKPDEGAERRLKRKTLANFSATLVAVIMGVLGTVQGFNVGGETEQVKAQTAITAKLVKEASPAEKVDVAYELLMSAIRDQKADIRELRRDLRRVWRRLRQSPEIEAAAADKGEEVGPPTPTRTDLLPADLDKDPRVRAIQKRRAPLLEALQ